VAEARHGEDALRVIEETAEPFDLVVTEMMMPVMSGYKLGRRLARQRPGLPVLYISAGVSESLASSGSISAEAVSPGGPGASRERVAATARLTRPWTTAARLVELVTSYGRAPPRPGKIEKGRTLSEADFEFRGGSPRWMGGLIARTRTGEPAFG
jgi:CheY-like chemotaxis protein